MAKVIFSGTTPPDTIVTVSALGTEPIQPGRAYTVTAELAEALIATGDWVTEPHTEPAPARAAKAPKAEE